MPTPLKGKKIAVLVAHGFEQVEMTEPKKALEQAGAKVTLISPEKEKVKGWQHVAWGDEFPVELSLQDANPEEFDALVLPGGLMNPDKLRMNDTAIEFIQKIFKDKKPIAAICHGSWPLINAEIVKGHKMTSWPSIRCDLINAGADWVDQQVVVDKNLVTSRKPDDIPAFNKQMIALFSRQ